MKETLKPLFEKLKKAGYLPYDLKIRERGGFFSINIPRIFYSGDKVQLGIDLEKVETKEQAIHVVNEYEKYLQESPLDTQQLYDLLKTNRHAAEQLQIRTLDESHLTVPLHVVVLDTQSDRFIAMQSCSSEDEANTFIEGYKEFIHE